MPTAQRGSDPQGSSDAQPGPTVLRILVGTQLRRLRELAGVSQEAAGEAIRASHAKISRLELGRVGFKERDVADLLTLYGVTDERERRALMALAGQANMPGWWHRYGDILPTWFEVYVGLEEATSVIRTYQVQFVPGLLQTARYARAVILLAHSADSDNELDRRVTLRMQRRKLLTGPNAPTLWAVVDEAALRRPIGGRDVMREQLQHLIEMIELPNVTVQVMPFQSGGHVGAGGPFSILRFSEVDLPDIVYLEQLTSALYLDKREDLDHYLTLMERLCVQAEPPAETAKLLTRIIEET